jgi:hypothetical protein
LLEKIPTKVHSFRADASKFVLVLFKVEQRVSNLPKVGNPKCKNLDAFALFAAWIGSAVNLLCMFLS